MLTNTVDLVQNRPSPSRTWTLLGGLRHSYFESDSQTERDTDDVHIVFSTLAVPPPRKPQPIEQRHPGLKMQLVQRQIELRVLRSRKSCPHARSTQVNIVGSRNSEKNSSETCRKSTTLRAALTQSCRRPNLSSVDSRKYNSIRNGQATPLVQIQAQQVKPGGPSAHTLQYVKHPDPSPTGLPQPYAATAEARRLA